MTYVFQGIVSLLLFLGIVVPVYAAFRQTARPARTPMHRRFAMTMGTARETVFEHPMLGPLMATFLPVGKGVTNAGLRERVRRDLDAQGNPMSYSVDEFLAICFASGVALTVLAALMDLLLLQGRALLLSVPVMAGVGFFGPVWTLRSQGQRRVERIGGQLPYTLDLVSLMMTAGSTFTEAVQTLIHDNPDDDLNQEFAICLREMKLGTPRGDALAHLAERIPLESLRSVIAAVNQAEQLGTSLAETLEIQAEVLRRQRTVRAEKLSASASLRILIPSMLILIAVVIVVFAPIIVRMVRGELL